MAEPVEWLAAFGLDFAPLVSVLLQRALPQVVEPSVPIVACKHVHRSLVQHCRVVCPRTRWGAFGLQSLPDLSVQVEVE